MNPQNPSPQTQKACDLMDKGYTIAVKSGHRHKGQFRYPKNKEGLYEIISEFEKYKRGIAFYLVFSPDRHKDRRIASIDFDHKEDWEVLMRHKDHIAFKNVIFNPSLRGGHIIGVLPPRWLSSKKRVKTVLPCGLRADFLNDHVKVLGEPERVILAAPSVSELAEIPVALLPKLKSIRAKEPIKVPVIEGTRNQTLFNLLRNCGLQEEDLPSLAWFVNEVLFFPPLPEEEVSSVVASSKNYTLQEKTKESDRVTDNRATFENLNTDRGMLAIEMFNSFRYYEEEGLWYNFNGQFWVAIDKVQLHFAISAILEKNVETLRQSYTPRSVSLMITQLATQLQVLLQVRTELLQNTSALAFSNGLLAFENHRLIPHSSNYFIRDCLSVNYNPIESLSERTLEFFHTLVGGNLHNLTLLRLMFYNIYSNNKGSQTAFVFQGPPAVGKSVIVGVAVRLAGRVGRTISLNDIRTGFQKHGLTTARVLALNELDTMGHAQKALLKSIIGKDDIPYELKYRQGTPSAPCQATVIGTTNKTFQDVVGDEGALRDRLFWIPCYPSRNDPDPMLQDKLFNNISGILNWARELPRQIVAQTVRATALNNLLMDDPTPYTQFISARLCKVSNQNQYIYTDHLVKLFREYAMDKSITVEVTDQIIWQQILKELISTYKLDIKTKRKLDRDRRKKQIFMSIVSVETGEKPLGPPPQQSYLDLGLSSGVRVSQTVTGEGPNRIEKLFLREVLPSSGREEGIYSTIDDKPESLGPTTWPTIQVPAAEHVPQALVPELQDAPMDATGDECPTEDNKPYTPSFLSELEGLPQELGSAELIGKSLSPKAKRGYPDSDSLLEKYKGGILSNISVQQTGSLFQKLHELLLDCIVTPLSSLPAVKNYQYSPHKPNKDHRYFYPRIEIVLRLGPLANYFETKLGCGEAIWTKAFKEVQEEHPDHVNLNQTKTLAGRLFPYCYGLNGTSFRMDAHPHNTVRSLPKIFKFKALSLLEQHSGLFFYDMDMSACHLRISTLTVEQSLAPFLYKACTDKDLWRSLAEALITKHPEVEPLGLPLVRKAIKVYCLAQLNGAAVYNPKNLQLPLEGKLDSKGNPALTYKVPLAKILEQKDYVQEFNRVAKNIYQNKKVYLPIFDGPTVPVRKKTGLKDDNGFRPMAGDHTLNSRVFCCFETILLTYVVEYLGSLPRKLVPIFSQHDGLVFVTDTKMSQEEIQTVSQGFTDFLQGIFPMDLPVEISREQDN